MTRGNFTGSRMSGTIRSGSAKRFNAKAAFMAKAKGENALDTMSDDERYKEIFEAKMEELRSKAKGGARFAVAPPGTNMAGSRELSPTAQKVIDDIIHKRAQKFAKERSKVVKVVPKVFTGIQGGKIDARGCIYGPDNRWIATVDKKTGKIKSRSGFTICKYNSKSSVCEFRIAQFIANEYRTRKGNLYAARGHGTMAYGVYGQAGGALSGGGGTGMYGGWLDPDSEGVWGMTGNDESLWGWSSTPSSGGGGVWGGGGSGGGGGVWGGGDDNKGGGFWG